MYEYAVDRNSGQFKAPFNQIKNEPNVFTYKDTAIVTPNSDTPYSFAWMDLRAEPIVLSVPAVDPKRYYSVMLCDGNTYNYGYIGSRATGSEAGDYMVVGPDWKGDDPARDQEGVPVEHTVFGGGLSHPAFQPGRHRQRQEGAGRLQGADALRVPEAAGAARRAGHRLSENRQGTREDELLRVPRLRAAVRARAGRTRRRYAPSLRASASGRARPSTSRTSRWSTSWRSAWA